MPDTTEYTETVTLREKARALRDKLMGGGNVTPAELAEADQLAAAEAEVETARRTRWEKEKAETERAAATAEADRIAADMAPTLDDDSTELAEAWAGYLDAVEAALDRREERAEQCKHLAAAVRKTGVPIVSTMAQTNRTTRVAGDRVVVSEADTNNATATWGGVTYTAPRVDGKALPHNADQSERARELKRRVTGW